MSLSVQLFNNQATSGTTAYPSVASSPQRNGHWHFDFEKTGTGTGSLSLQFNNRTDTQFQADPTAGWKQHDLLAGTGITGGALDVPSTNPWTAGEVKIANWSPRRVRWLYTNATGTTVLNGWAAGS
jgi:hypothetical protein